MSLKNKSRHILVELKGHAPFTLLGALLGIALMLVFRNVGAKGGYNLFMIFHPGHVILSAMVTASMLKVHAWKKKFLTVLVISYLGSVGIATLSDVIIPHIGANLLGLNVPTHAQMHHHEDEHGDHEEKLAIHLGFIEEWYIVNPAAFLGIFIAYFIPRTKFPHSAHVLLSTWASSSYLLMSIKPELTIASGIGIFATLFIATWLPCCISDIIFPLLFVKPDVELAQECADHRRHSHEHSYKK